MKVTALVWIFLFCINLHARVGFVSHSSRKVIFSISDGLVYSKEGQDPAYIVKNQLKYLFGVLNEMDSGIDFPNLKIGIKKVRSENGLIVISYFANGAIAWDSQRMLPKTIDFVLPKRGDEEGLVEFLGKYQAKCSKKPSVLASFWNYYRPGHDGCPLKSRVADDAILLAATLDEEDSFTDKRSPNYFRMFDDDALEITVIMTKDNLKNPQDISIWDFNKLCEFFSKEATFFNKTNNECHTKGERDGHLVKSHIFLIDDFNDKPDSFLQNIRPYISTSDVVTYNGHSGLGLNIDSWTKFYPIPKNKYQILFLNSCDTYGYFTNESFNKVKTLNQVGSSGEYLDVVLNATPNYFGTFSDSHMNLMSGLLKRADFFEILKALPLEQHSLLLFEPI